MMGGMSSKSSSSKGYNGKGMMSGGYDEDAAANDLQELFEERLQFVGSQV